MKFQKLIALAAIALFAGSCAVQKSQTGNSTLRPSDALATSATIHLYQNLAQIPQRGFMFGQQDATLYGVGWKYDKNKADVKSVCGDYPAVYGWELGHIEHKAKYSLDSVNFDIMRQRIIEAYKRGGVNTISWHCDNPLTGGNAWNVTTEGVVTSVLPGGQKHDLFMGWVDEVAGFVGSLKSGGKAIPVLFRPFHEQTGSWFWWGESHCTPQEYIALVRMVIDRFKEKGVHNLIYIYSPDQTDQPVRYLERYPGDNYMDILGVDYYQQQGAAGADQFIAATGKILNMISIEAKKRNKLMAFSETGLEGVSMNNWWTDVLLKTVSPYPIVYVMVWRNAYERPGHFFGPYPGHPASDNFVKFYQDGKTLFQGDIKNMYK